MQTKKYLLLLTASTFLLFFGILPQTSKSLTWSELITSSPHVLSALTSDYKTTQLSAASNKSLKITVTPLNFTQGKWNYQVEWRRTLNRTGSWYLSPDTDRQNILAHCDQAPANSAGVSFDCPTETNFVLSPNTTFRFIFYSKPNRKGVILLSKKFTSLSAPEEQAADTDPSAQSDSGGDCGNLFCIINSIMVTSPREGEVWETGTTHKIRWYVQPLATSTRPSKVNIYLQTVYELPCSPASQNLCLREPSDLGALIAEKIENNGSFDWEMPNDALLPGKYYKISVIDSSLITSGNYRSKPSLSNNFTVIRNRNLPQFITITYPTEAEIWKIGTEQSIYFRYSRSITSVNISLKKVCTNLIGCGLTNYTLAANYVPQKFLIQLSDEQIAGFDFTLGADGQTAGLLPGTYTIKVTDALGIISAVSRQPVIVVGN